MSQSEEAISQSVKLNDELSNPFLFVNIEENIKQENVEEEELEEEEVNGRINGCETPHTVENEDRSKEILPQETDYQQDVDCESVFPSKVSVDSSKSTDSNLENNNQAFSCDKCFISFISPIYLEGHKNRCRATVKTDENWIDKDIVDSQTLSDASDVSTPKSCRVKQRAPRRKTKHQCKICGRGFARLFYLTAHEAMHGGFKCDMCDYTTDLRKNLKRHMFVHSREEEKIYSCPHCSYTAAKSSYLRKHVAKHSEDKTFSCSFCRYATAVAENLSKHMLTHESQKPFACSHCYYSSTRKAQLAKHLEKFHSAPCETGT